MLNLINVDANKSSNLAETWGEVQLTNEYAEDCQNLWTSGPKLLPTITYNMSSVTSIGAYKLFNMFMRFFET